MKLSSYLIILCLIYCYGSSQISTQTTVAIEKPDTITVNATPTWLSEFDYRGQMMGGNTLVIPVNINVGNFSYQIWTGYDLSKSNNQEIDYSGCYSFNLGDDIIIKPGLTVYTYPKQDSAFGFFNDYEGIGGGYYSSEIEPNIEVDFTIAGIKFSPQCSYNKQIKSTTYELNAEYDYPVKYLHTEIELYAQAGQTYVQNASLVRQPPRVVESFSYYSLGFLVPYEISKHFTLKAGWQYNLGSGYIKRVIRPIQYLKMPLSTGVFSLQIETDY